MEHSAGATQSSGMDPKLAGLLAYLIPPITGIIFFIIEKTNRVVRWHAAQSIVFGNDQQIDGGCGKGGWLYGDFNGNGSCGHSDASTSQWAYIGLESAEVVRSAGRDTDQVFFGATVRLRSACAEERSVTIVGVDEVDPARGRVSWISPVARSLIKARAGDTVRVRTPGGEQMLEILEVHYGESGE